MDISSEIKKAFQQLLEQPSFLQNIQEYTQSALQTISGQTQSKQIDCPPPYILMLIHSIRTNNFSFFPPNVAAKINSLISAFIVESQDEGRRIDNSIFQNLSNVEWKMSIQRGRQVYQVRLSTYESEKPFVLKLNYQKLSILSFQVNQLVGRVSQLGEKTN